MQPHENDWCIFDERTNKKFPEYFFLSQSNSRKWCLYGPSLKDNKAREKARTREIMQSIPDSAHEIPIRNFILRFRPRSSEFPSARYTELVTLNHFLDHAIQMVSRAIGATVHWIFVCHFSCRLLFHADRTSKPKGGKKYWRTQEHVNARKWHRCSQYLSM